MAEMWICPEQRRISNTPLKVEVNFHAFSVTEGGKCGFSQITFPPFRFLFWLPPCPYKCAVHKPFNISSKATANQQVAHNCHGAYSDLTLT
jgi:hypothetical protein